MNVFSNYYQQPQLQQQQQPQNMAYPYQLSEVLYPDFYSYPNPNDLNASYQVYNLDLSAQVQNNTNGYYVYKPASDSNNNQQQQQQQQGDADKSVESILKKNPDVWKAYKSGNFSVKDFFENGHRRIVLKEKGKKAKDWEYTVKKYKVTVNNQNSSSQHQSGEQSKGANDDHVLLISFSSHSLPNAQQPQVIQPSYPQQPEFIQPSNNTQLVPSNSFINPANNYEFTGPGSELIYKIINGDDEDFEYLVPEVHELVGSYTVQSKPNEEKQYQDDASVEFFTKNSPRRRDSDYSEECSSCSSDSDENEKKSPSRSASRNSESAFYRPESRTSVASEHKTLSRASEPSRASNVGSRQSQVASRNSEAPSRQSQVASRNSQAPSRSSEIVSRNSQPISRNTQLSQTPSAASRNRIQVNETPLSRVTPATVRSNRSGVSRDESQASRISAYSGDNLSRGSVVSNAKSSARNTEANETQSIGPGSLAGGSLFGGYIPSNFETASNNKTLDNKSALSEATLKEEKPKKSEKKSKHSDKKKSRSHRH